MARSTALSRPPVLTSPRLSDYFITPADLRAWARSLNTRDLWGLGALAVAGLLTGWRLGDISAGLFAAGLVLALWWRLDSRWLYGAALVLLVLIPVMQFAYDRDWLFSGSGLASGLAVAVWYLLAIGVVRQLLELRAAPAPATTVTTTGVSAVSPAAAPPIAAPQRTRTPAATKPLPVPAWRRRLAALELETAPPVTGRQSVDGLRRQPASRRRAAAADRRP